MASPDEIWLIDFGDPHPGEPAQRRPGIVVGPHPSYGPEFPFALVVPLTATHRGLSLHVEIDATVTTGLDHASYAQCELLRSVNRNRLIHLLGRIDPEASRQIADTIQGLLGYW
jgi:mRNA interferase MazF